MRFKVKAMSALDVEIIYIDRPAAETFLGEDGMIFFKRELYFILGFIAREKWPLVKVVVDYWTDMEIASWHAVWVMMYFQSTFTIADKWLHILYKELDAWDANLDAKEREALLGKVVYDVHGLIPEDCP